MVLRGPEVGDSTTHHSFSSDTLELNVSTGEVTGIREVLVDGIQQKIYDLRLSSEKDGLVGDAVADSTGRLIKVSFGEEMEGRREPEELAKEEAKELELAMNDAWDRLPGSYQWLKNWEYV